MSTKYTPFAIPRRDEQPSSKPAPTDKINVGVDVSFSGARFAEIEIDFNSRNLGQESQTPGITSAAERALRFFSSITPPEPIEQKTQDPLRLKFYEMRSLATDRPFARDDSELFYKQAKYMADFTDDFQGDAKFFMYFPYYQHMGYEQLRTYFTWRAKARNGEMPPTSVSYVFLYVYELLNNVGVSSPSEGLDKLLATWATCLKFAPALENYMPQWIKDYHIYFDMPYSFAEFVKEYNLYKYYSVTFLFETSVDNRFELWNRISGYDVTKSKFWSEGNEQLFIDCFYAVLDGIRELCGNSGVRIEDLLIYGAGRRMPWQPFKQALFYPRHQQADRLVEMPGQEFFYCKNGRWSVNLPIYYSTQKDFVGYLVKKTEACLRQTVKYKYKLTAEPKARYDAPFGELKKLGNRGAAVLDKTIENAVDGFHKNLNRTVVTINQDNLARIRMEAQGTLEKLIVLDGVQNNGEWKEERGELGDEGTGEISQCTVYSVQCTYGNENAEDEVNEAGGDEDGWETFRQALSLTEIKAMAIVLHGNADVKAFADENGVMLEVLADGINEKAADLIGDSILELDEGMTIYNDYRDMVERIVELSEDIRREQN